ncbi:MAG: class IIb bacteriocin, lactobin A/cerein 7B family [Daejeonella sp.]
METKCVRFDSFDGMSELSELEKQDIKGGFWPVILGVIGAAAGAAYLYEFGYNMVDKAFQKK